MPKGTRYLLTATTQKVYKERREVKLQEIAELMQLHHSGFKNYSDHSTREVKEIVDFAADGVELKKVAVKNIKQTGKYDHLWSWSGVFNQENQSIRLSIARADRFPDDDVPRRPYRVGAPLPPVFNDWKEALVFAAAHEICHYIQWQEKRSYDEIEAEERGWEYLKKWRAR